MTQMAIKPDYHADNCNCQQQHAPNMALSGCDQCPTDMQTLCSESCDLAPSQWPGCTLICIKA